MLSTSTGDALDVLAKENRLSRMAAINANAKNVKIATKDGSTFGDNSITSIPSGTLIGGTNDAGDTISFYVDSTYPVTSTANVVYVGVVATTAGEENNVSPGALTTINYNSDILYVFNSNAISNGALLESDESLRYRIQINQALLAKASFAAIKAAALSVPGVSDVVILSDIITTVYIKASELYPRSSLISDVQYAVTSVIAHGRSIVAKLPEYINVNLVVNASNIVSSAINTNSAQNLLSQIAEDYINNLDIGESLSLATLHSIMLSNGSSYIQLKAGSSLFAEAYSETAYGYDRVKTLKTVNTILPYEKFTFNSLRIK